MTISSTVSRLAYNGNGSTVAFSVSFKFIDPEDLKVYVGDALQVLDTDYTVTGGSGSTGTVTFSTAPALTDSVVILRDPAILQETDYVANDPFPAETHERALDKLTMIAQRHSDLLGRSMTLADSETSDVSLLIPSPEARKIVGWNSTGTALENVDASTLATIAAFGTANADVFSGDGVQTDFTLSDNPAALNNLDVSIGGVTQTPGTDYTWSSGYTLTFTSAPPAGTGNILVRYMQALAQGQSDAAAAYWTDNSGSVRDVESALQMITLEHVSVSDPRFGAVGDGVTDDTAAIQAAVNYAMSKNGLVHFNGPATYLITSKITVKVTRDLTEEISGAAQFSDNCAAYLVGYGSPVVKAGAAMSSMFELIYDTTDSDIGPFFSVIEGLGFDGNNVASVGISSNYSLGVTYQNNRFWNLPVGVDYSGYGVIRALRNVFKCSTGFKVSGGGGDSLFFGNDFYAAANSTSCLVFGYYGGNSRVISNVFTNENGYTSTFAIKLDGTTAATTEEIRNVVISDNEFCGYTTGIYAVGKGGGVYNVYDCIVRGNHTLPYGGSNPGKLLEALDCSGFIVSENKFNSISYSSATETSGLALTRCNDFKVSNNFFENYSNSAVRLTDCVRTTVSENSFYDNGKLGAAYEIVRVGGASSSRNYFTRNRFYQSSDSYAENGIVELAGTNSTFAFDNVFLGVNKPYTKVGAISVLRREEFGSAAPTTEYWWQGDIVWNTGVSAGGSPGWVCVTSGTPGTWKAMPNVAA